MSLLATRLSILSRDDCWSAVPRETLIEDNGAINLFGTIIVLERTNNCKTTIISNKFPLRQNKAIKRGSMWYRHPTLHVGRSLAGGLNRLLSRSSRCCCNFTVDQWVTWNWCSYVRLHTCCVLDCCCVRSFYTELHAPNFLWFGWTEIHSKIKWGVMCAKVHPNVSTNVWRCWM